MAGVNTVTLTGVVYDSDYATARNVYENVFADAGITLHNEPEIIDYSRIGLLDEISLTVDVADTDDAFWAIAQAEGQLQARNDFAKIQPVSPTPERTTVVVNMFGGPGAGKTTAAFEVAEKLKKAGYVVEYAPEYAKELVWDMNDPRASTAQRAFASEMLSGRHEYQTALYAEQLRRVKRCIGQCDFVVTDSPPILGAAYLKEDYPQQREDFERMALSDFNGMRNFNMIVERADGYEQAGRVQSPDEALAIDENVKGFLDRHEIYYGTYDHNQVDQAIENMQKTHARFARHDEARASLRQVASAGSREHGSSKQAETAGKSPAEADKGGQRPRKGAVINMAKEMAAQQASAPREYESVTMPNKGYKGRDLFKPITGRDGNDYIQIKFPPHTPEVVNVAGETIDISNATMIVPGGNPVAIQSKNGELGVRTGSVTQWNNDPAYKSVSFPKTNKEGEPWNVELRLERGHWEHPDAQGAARGKWVKEGAITNRVAVAEISPAMELYRAERSDYARERRSAEHEQTRMEDHSKDAPTQEQPTQEQGKSVGTKSADAPKGASHARTAAPGPSGKAVAPANPASDAKAMANQAKSMSQGLAAKPAPTIAL